MASSPSTRQDLPASQVAPPRSHKDHSRGRVGGYLLAAAGVGLMTGLIAVVPGANHTSNIPLLYLLCVMAMAYRFGRGPAVFASVLAVLSFDWFFVHPRYAFTVSNPDEWLALFVFLVTAMVISQLTAILRLREQEASALANASLAVASQVGHHQAISEVLRQLCEVTESEIAAIVTLSGESKMQVVASYRPQSSSSPENPDFSTGAESKLMRAVLEGAGPIGWSSQPGSAADNVLELQVPPEEGVLFLPLALDQRILGVLYLRLRPGHNILGSERQVIEALSRLAAVSLERHQLVLAETEARAVAEADRLKTALLAMISHDLRSPLTSIKTSVTGLLQVGRPWEERTQRELLVAIDGETDRLNRMVGSVLALSRLEAGAWRPQCEVIPVTELVGTALDAFDEEQNSRIETHLDGAPAEVWLDVVQMVQVLHNLLENALKYSPPQSPVHLSLTQQNQQLVIEVIDAGAGLAPGEEGLVFQRFYRGPQWRESSLPGTGLGLAVCCGLVEAHGGHVGARNRVENGHVCGAVFSVTLPLDGALPG